MRPSLSIHIQLPSNLGLTGCVETTALPLPRHVFDAVLAAEHEEREVQAGEHIGRELREIRVLERSRLILIPAAPQEARREVAPQRRIAEKAAPASVKGRLVRRRSGRTDSL